MALSGVNELFQLKLNTYSPDGEIGESLIARWLRWKGWQVLPVYEKEIDNGKGPRLFLNTFKQLIAPDLFIFKSDGKHTALWIEAKHKSVFSHHRITDRWVTGIDLRHYKDYIKVNKLSPWPIWLFFLHQKDRCDKRPNEPWPCPTGLYGQTIDFLVNNENHRHQNWGNSGMVYWAETTLKKLASLDEVLNAHHRP